MGQRVSLLAIDLDGTLLGSDKSISDANVNAVALARQAGVEVLIVSARPPFGMDEASRILGLDNILVAYNGAYVLDRVSGKMLLHHPMTSEEAKVSIQLIREHDLYVGYYCGMEWYVELECEEMRFEQRSLRRAPNVVTDLIAYAPPQPDKLIVIDLNRQDRLAAFHEATHELLPGLNIHYSSPVSIEIGSKDASKGLALSWIAEHLDIPRSEVMAIGDNFNDLSMFDVAGNAVAVGNAPEAVQAQAGIVVASNDMDGVAEAIYRWILSRP